MTYQATNKDLAVNEFICAQNIKRAMVYIDSNPELAKMYLTNALKELYLKI